MHAAPESAPASDEYVAMGQGVQLVAPAAVANVPAAQSVQLDEDALGANDPGEHARQVALKKPLAAVPLEIVPAGHAAQAVDDDTPTALELVPRGQGVQSDPGVALNEPSAQREHEVAPVEDEYPAGHCRGG